MKAAPPQSHPEPTLPAIDPDSKALITPTHLQSPFQTPNYFPQLRQRNLILILNNSKQTPLIAPHTLFSL